MDRPSDFGRDGGVLRGQGRVDRGDQEGFLIRHRLQGHVFLRAKALVAADVGDPDQEQRALLDMLLVGGDLGQRRLFGGIGDGDDGPGLQVGAGGGGLRRGDQRLQRAGGQRVRAIAADRAVREQQSDVVVPGPGRGRGGAVAKGKSIGGGHGDGLGDVHWGKTCSRVAGRVTGLG